MGTTIGKRVIQFQVRYVRLIGETMEKCIAWLAKPIVFIIGCVVIVLFLMLILPNEAAKAASYTPEGASFDTSFFYAPTEVYTKTAAYSAEGRAAYLQARWTFDLVFPLAYGFFCLTAVAFGGTRLKINKKALQLLILLPILAVFFDLAENTMVSLVMANFPKESMFLAIGASTATLCKWTCVISAFSLAMLLPILAGIRAIWHRRR